MDELRELIIQFKSNFNHASKREREARAREEKAFGEVHKLIHEIKRDFKGMIDIRQDLKTETIPEAEVCNTDN